MALFKFVFIPSERKNQNIIGIDVAPNRRPVNTTRDHKTDK